MKTYTKSDGCYPKMCKKTVRFWDAMKISYEIEGENKYYGK